MAESSVKQVRTTHYIVILALVIVAASAIAASGYFYVQYRKSTSVLSAQSKNESILKLIQSVGKLMVLPQETPTIATVSDINKLKGQAFFKQAQNGDKVLIYTQAREAILYRPSLNKIIAVSTINVGDSAHKSATQAAAPSAKAVLNGKVSVQLFNGTTTPGLTQVAEKRLAADDKAVDVVDRSNAARSDYQKTLVVDLKGQDSQEASHIATDLGGSVGKLPAGEQATASADILVILGRDFLGK